MAVELKWPVELRLLISCPWDWDVNLDYSGWFNIITGILLSGRGRQEKEDQRDGRRRSIRPTRPALKTEKRGPEPLDAEEAWKQAPP